jgi:hypothetical protein
MNFLKTFKRSVIGIPVVACMAATSFPAFAWDPIQDAFTTTAKTNLNFRMRYEDVTDGTSDGTAGDLLLAPADTKKDAQALTLRSRITYETGKWQDLSLLLEMDDVSALLPEDYDDDINGNSQFSKITDPEGTEVNQAALSYAGVPGTVLKYGRQRITLDNERFIGGVGFRQNEQTYDAFSASNKSIKNLTAFYAYINNVNRIFGEENANGDHEMNTNLVNLNYKVGNYGALSGYVYSIDDEAPSAGAYVEGAYSSDTYGARWAGKVPMGDQAFKYNLEYATQSEGANNPVEYDADYGLAEMSFGSDLVTVGIGYEVLGADDGAITKSSGATTSRGFQTPLATLHKFQGWTDQFLGGGTGNLGVGIEDQYAVVQGKINNYAWSVNYHQYEAAESSTVASLDGLSDLGSEWGVSLDKTWGNYLVGVKYSDYSVGDTDTGFKLDDKSKIWLTMQASF